MNWLEEDIPFANGSIKLRRGGTGSHVLVLHDELGDSGPLPWQDDLAQTRKLLHPHHPGFGHAPRVEWLRSVRDLAGYYAAWLRATSTRPIDVVGVSFGGWIAAEMMAADPTLFGRVVLVSPFGIRPQTPDEIFDLFQVTTAGYLAQSVTGGAESPAYRTLAADADNPDRYAAWEDAKAEVARLAWEPYMFSYSLPPLLSLSAMPATLVIGGRDDRVLPFSALRRYADAIAEAKLVAIEACGHRPDIEKREDFVRELRQFFTA